MASFKGDDRYQQGYDSSDPSMSDDESPIFTYTKDQWIDMYMHELQMLYRWYREAGAQLFGNAFHQHGSLADFVDYVYLHMQP